MDGRRQTRATAHRGGRESLLAEVDSCWTALAVGLSHSGVVPLAQKVERLSRQLVELVVFLQLCQARKVARRPAPSLFARTAGSQLADWVATAEERIGPALLCAPDLDLELLSAHDLTVAAAISRLSSRHMAARLAAEPPQILGWVHERLLGLRLARRSARGVATGVRTAAKDGGVFYTPECVVRYMVAAALASQPQLISSLPSQVQDAGPEGLRHKAALDAIPRIVDPACGCGFFLLGACRCLMDRCRQRGIRRALHTVACCLHGTDLDPEAVLAAQRSLWLELVTGGGTEGGGTIPAGLSGEIRDELMANLRCANALDDSAWPAGLGRFDVVIGNPPYRRELNAKRLLDPVANTPWGQRHRAPRMDLWYYFLHRGLELLRPGGRLCYVVDSYWAASRGAAKLISTLQQEAQIEEVFSLGRASVFPRVSGRHMILRLVKGAAASMTTVKRPAAPEPSDAESILSGKAPLVVFQKTAEQLFRAGRIDLEPPADELLSKLACWPPLGRLGKVRQGIVENPATVTAGTNRRYGNRWQTGEGVFSLTPEEIARLQLPETESHLLRAYHDLGDLGRYFLAERASRVLIYSTAETCPEIDACPELRAHLGRFRPILEARRETRQQLRPWWQLHWPREEGLWRAAKVISVQMGRRPAFVASADPVYVPFSVNVLVPNAHTREHLNYLAALLNSRLLWKWFSHHAKRRGVGLEINGHVLAEAPIRTIDFESGPERAAHQRLVELAVVMGELSRLVRAAALPQQKAALERRLSETDREIDRAVYALYGLTDTEVATVEGAELAT